MRQVVLAALLSSALLAGCSSSPGAQPPAAMPQAEAPDLAALAAGLPCEPDPAAGLSRSLKVLDVEPFADDPGFHDEIDQARVGGRTLLLATRPAPDIVDLLDATDPAALRLLGSWVAEVADYADDAKFLPDGSGFVVGGGHTLRIVDARDPANPALESTLELDTIGTGAMGNGAHMVAVWTVGGVDHVSISKAEGGDLSIFAVRGAPGGRTLERLAQVAATPLGPLPDRPDPIRSHDTWFEVDPATGTPLLWVANVFWGVVAYDVGDPARPVLASTILPDPANPLVGYMHSVQATHLGGRRLVVGVQEYGTGALKVWDATDLASPRQIAYYHADPATTPFHGLQVVGRHAYAAHFHDGLFVFDLAGLSSDVAAPVKLELFAHAPPEGSTEDPRVPVSPGQAYFGTLDVVVQDGIVYTNEAEAGVRSLAFGCLVPGDPAASSTG